MAEQQDAGQQLAKLARGETEELRIALREYQNHKFLDIRKWWRNNEGQWLPGKGVTVKVRELAAVRDAIAKAIGLTSTQQQQQRKAAAG